MHVSWLPEQVIDSGQVGLTHSPGAYHASRDDDLADLARMGVDVLVCLQQEHEFDYVDIPGETLADRERAVERLGIRLRHFPIPDFGTPELEPTARLLRDILADLERDERVVVHCYAGLGRAGTVVTSLLVAAGMAPQAAIEQVRESRPGAIQTVAQEEFVHRIADSPALREPSF